MGGQACVFYGAAEFSRDCDIVLLADESNFVRLNLALNELLAECIAIPEFKPEYLLRGHAVHFRCFHPDVANLRLDVMAKLRGCDRFEELWTRRTSIEDLHAGVTFELLSVEDLVLAKKTQRDKDWPMIRRLVEAHYSQFQDQPTAEMIRFWLRESRSPSMLWSVAEAFPDLRNDLKDIRPWLSELDLNDFKKVEFALREEERVERSLDEEYWRPLKQELTELRLNRSRRPQP